MSETVFETAATSLLYALALSGMAGVWLVPAHLWSILVNRRIGVPLINRLRDLIAATTVLIAIAFGCYVAVETLPHVFRCLEDSGHCSANRATGLISLAMFGGAVIVVEGIWIASRVILTWRSRSTSTES